MAAQEHVLACPLAHCTSTVCNVHSQQMPQCMTQTTCKINSGMFSGKRRVHLDGHMQMSGGRREGGGQVRSEPRKLFTQVAVALGDNTFFT